MQRLRRLASRRAVRWEEGRFVTEGPKLLHEALVAGARIESLFVDDVTAGDEHRALAGAAERSGAEVHTVAAGVLDRVCDAVTPQPIVGIVAMVHVPYQELPLEGLTVVGIGLQDPGNAGTVIRSAAASGGTAVVFSTGAVDIYNPKTVRASAGALFHLPVATGVPAEDLLDHLGRAGVTRVGTAVRDGRDHDHFDWSGRAAVVLGGESRGLPEALDRRLDERVTIRMQRGIESLNVAMAATVICFEAARQRRAAATRGVA